MTVNIQPVRQSCVLQNNTNTSITILGRYSLKARKRADLFQVISPLKEDDVINAFSNPDGELYKLIFKTNKVSLLDFNLVTQSVGRVTNLVDVEQGPSHNGDHLRYNSNTGFWEHSPVIKSKSWNFETLVVGEEFLGGFYTFGSTDNDFSPSITYGDINASTAAHLFVVLGAATVDEVQITVSGVSITDAGVRTPADTQVITIVSGTGIDSYFETSKKWLGQVTIETTAGTAVTANYGYSKYHDINNQDFQLIGIEVLWTSGASGTSSNIELLHHKATGWTFNSGAVPTPPAPIASRLIDHGVDTGHVAGQPGAWKRVNLNTNIQGSDSEGILFRITSESSGVGNQSFRFLNAEISFELLTAGTI